MATRDEIRKRCDRVDNTILSYLRRKGGLWVKAATIRDWCLNSNIGSAYPSLARLLKKELVETRVKWRGWYGRRYYRAVTFTENEEAGA